VIDTVGIQPYIFSSNRLRENVGASYLVECLGKEWLEEALKKSIGEKYHFPKIKADFNLGLRLDQESLLQAEVIYTAGGNSVISEFKAIKRSSGINDCCSTSNF
jgi:hypothetical protein